MCLYTIVQKQAREVRQFYIFLNVVTRRICQEALAACMGKMIHSRGVPDGYNRKTIGKKKLHYHSSLFLKNLGIQKVQQGKLAFIRPMTLLWWYLIKIVVSSQIQTWIKLTFKLSNSRLHPYCANQLYRQLNYLHALFIKFGHDMCSLLFQEMYNKMKQFIQFIVNSFDTHSPPVWCMLSSHRGAQIPLQLIANNNFYKHLQNRMICKSLGSPPDASWTWFRSWSLTTSSCFSKRTRKILALYLSTTLWWKATGNKEPCWNFETSRKVERGIHQGDWPTWNDKKTSRSTLKNHILAVSAVGVGTRLGKLQTSGHGRQNSMNQQQQNSNH